MRFRLTSILIFLTIISFCQETIDSILKLENTIKGDFVNVYSDAWNNIYAINKQGHFLKINPKGDTVYTFQDKSLKANLADVSNPLRILISDNEQNRIFILDKTLSINGLPINLDELQILNSNVFCNSRDNTFWIYDENLLELKKIDLKLNEIGTSGPLGSLTKESIKPFHIIQRNNSVFLSDTILGVYEFDQNATFITKLDLKGVGKFNIISNKLIYLNKQELTLVDLNFFDKKNIHLPLINIKDFSIQKNKLYVLCGGNIHIYRITL